MEKRYLIPDHLGYRKLHEDMWEYVVKEISETVDKRKQLEQITEIKKRFVEKGDYEELHMECYSYCFACIESDNKCNKCKVVNNIGNCNSFKHDSIFERLIDRMDQYNINWIAKNKEAMDHIGNLAIMLAKQIKNAWEKGE
jgi:hypothetical protein